MDSIDVEKIETVSVIASRGRESDAHVRAAAFECITGDITLPAVYLASDAAAYVAGSVLTVDGGAFIQGPAWSGGEGHGEEK